MRLRLPLQLLSAVLAAFTVVSFSETASAANTGNSVSINFGNNMDASAEKKAGADAIAVFGNLWNNTGAAGTGSKIGLTDSKGVAMGMSIAWSSSGVYSPGWTGTDATVNASMMKSYLDDGGSGANIVISGMDYLFYDVYIYCNTDSAAFKAKQVNGKNYTFKDGKLVEGTDAWGVATNKTTIVEGENYLKISAAGSQLKINGNGGSAGRGCISGIQIVETEYGGLYETANLANGSNVAWLATGATSPWSTGGTKNDWVNSTGGGADANSRIASVDVTGTATLTLDAGQTATADALFVNSGSLNISGDGTLKLINHIAIKTAQASSVVNINTTLDVADQVLRILGPGKVVLQKNNTWGNISGSSNFEMAAGVTLMLNGSIDGSLSGAFVSGENSKIVKSGTGNLLISGNASEAKNTWDIQKGGITLSSSRSTGAVSIAKGAFFGESYTDLTGAYQINLSKVSGSGEYRIQGSGNGTDANLATITGLDTFTGTVSVSSGQLLLDSVLMGRLKNDQNSLKLTGGTLTLTNSGLTAPIDTDGLKIEAGSTGSVRIYSSGTDVVYKGIQFLTTSGVSNNITLKVMRTSEADNKLTTLENVTGSVKDVNIQGNGKLKISGANTKLTLTGQFLFNSGAQGGELLIEDGTVSAGSINVNGDAGGNYATITQSGGNVTVGNINLAQWNNSSTKWSQYLFQSGELNVTSQFLSGNDGRGRLVISGGIANVKKYNLNTGANSQDAGRGAELWLTGGRLNLGNGGIVQGDGSGKDPNHLTKKVYLSGGTIGATEDWSTGVKLTLASSEGAAGTLNVDTTLYKTSNAATITWNGVVEGAGTMIVSGNGKLVLTGNNTFTGGVALKGGTLSLGHENALGGAGKRNLVVDNRATLESTVAGNLVDSLTLNNFSSLTLSGGGALTVSSLTVNGVSILKGTATITSLKAMSAGSSLDIGGPAKTGTLTIGSVEGAAAFMMDLLGDNTNDSITFTNSLGSGSALTLNLLLTEQSIGKTYTLLNGIGSGNGSKVSLNSGYRNSLTLISTEEGGNYKVAVGGTMTSKDMTWVGSTASGTWKLGGASSWTGADDGFFNGDNAIFGVPTVVGGEGKFQTVNLEGLLAPKSVKVTTGKDHNYLFTNADSTTTGILTGSMSLTKEGEGTLLIQTNTANNYSGATIVNGGTLEFAKGSFSGTGTITVGTAGTLKVHELLANAMTINGTLSFAFAGTLSNGLASLSNITWGTDSTLAISQGIVKGAANMFSGKTISVLNGGAFDLSGQDRSGKKFDLVLSGMGVQLANGSYTGALFNSGDSLINANGGIKSLTLGGDAMIVVGGGNASGNFTEGSRFDIAGPLNLNSHTLIKKGHGMLDIRGGQSAINGKLVIEEGYVFVEDQDFGTAAGSMSIDIKRGASLSTWAANTVVRKVFSDIVLDSSATDASKGYINNRNWATLGAHTAASFNFLGNIILKQGGSIMLGWGTGSTTGANISLLGSLTGSGNLYIDASGTTATDRVVYLAAAVSDIAGIQMIGKSDTTGSFILQLGSNGLGSDLPLKNATIASGLKISGGRDASVRIVASGADASYTGLNFQITEGLTDGMTLKVDSQSTDAASNYLTTLTNTTGTLQQISMGASAKLTMGGATNLKVQKDFTAAANSKFSLTGGSLELTGRLIVEGGSTINISGDSTVFTSKGKDGSRGVSLRGAGTVVNISGGTLTWAGKTGFGDNGSGNSITVNQSGGTLNLEQSWMGEWANTVASEYNLSKGTLNVSDFFQVGNDGSGKFTISGGTANINKLILGQFNSDNAQTHFITLSGGRLNLGSGGLVGGQVSVNRGVILSGGTLGASANWETSTELTLHKASDTASGVTVDTTLTGGGAGTITWKGIVKDDLTAAGGKLNITGTGTLKLAGTNSFTGDITITGSATLQQEGTALTSKVTIKDNGIFKMGAASKTAGAFDIQGGQLLLDKTGSIVGAIALSNGTINVTEQATLGALAMTGGTVNLEKAATQVGAVVLTQGTLNVKADATLATLSAGGGAVDISAGTLGITDNNLTLNNNATLKLTGTGQLASGVTINTLAATTTLEIAKAEANDFSNVLTGAGTLKINNTGNATTTTYKGTSHNYTGKIEVLQGTLTLDAAATTRATAQVNSGARLNLGGTAEQVTTITGNGKISFTNTGVNITSGSLLSGFNGTLILENSQQVTFTGTGSVGQTGSIMMGNKTIVEFGGNGTLILNNTDGTIHNIVLTTDGTIRMNQGNGLALYLDGASWQKNGNAGESTMLTLEVGNNKVYVTERSLSDTQLSRIILSTTQGKGDVILDPTTGELKVNIPLELTKPVTDNAYQSYQLTADHSADKGIFRLTGGNTNVRTLAITASQTWNTELALDAGVKLGLSQGRLTITNKDGENAGYAITGGTLGRTSTIGDKPETSDLSIIQNARGLVTISSTIDNTVYTLRKGGSGDLVMTGTLKNQGGVNVESGKLTLTGSSDKVTNAWLTNGAQLILGDGTKTYQVNYTGLKATAGATTILNAKAELSADFIINNGGTLHLLTGGTHILGTAITGHNGQTGTTHLGGNTSLTQPGGGDQNYTIDQGSTLTWNMSQATATGKTITGDGQINLHNTSGGTLDLRGTAIGTGWSGYTGTLALTGDHPITLELGYLGTGATVILNTGSTLIDKETGTDTRTYNITLGDNATWQLANTNGATYRGTLTLGTAGTLTGNADQTYTLENNISGGTLTLTGGTYHLGGNNTHTQTHAGANTTLISGSGKAFGNGLLLDQEGTIARITGTVTTGTLTGNANGTLQLNQDSHLTATNGTDWSGTLTGNGTLTLGGNNTLNSQDDATNGYTGTLNTTDGSRLTLGTSLGTATIHIGQNATLDITGNTRLSDNALTLGAGSTLTGGENYNGKLSITGNQHRENATSNGNLHLDTLHLTDTSAKLNVTGNLTIDNGGSFKLSDANSQDAYGALVTVDGSATLGGIYDLILDVNNTFTDGKETKNYILFKAQGGLNITTAGNATQLKLDASLEEFFTLNQNNFKNTGTVSITRKEMTCYLLDPTHVNPGGTYHNGYTNTNNTSYLGANANNDGINHPSVFYFDRKYTIAQGDNAYRLTNGDAWMNFHVKMTDTQIGAPTKLVVRENWMAPNDQGGILLSIRGSADDTYTGGTQIYQAKVKIDGTLNDQGNSGSSTLENGDVYFLGTGRVELTGAKAALILNTGGDNSNGEYTWNNDIHLQQGAVIEQTSSNNILAGNIKITDNAILRNTGDQILTLSGKNITGNQLKIQGNGNTDTPQSAIELATVNGDKVNAKLTLADISRNAHLTIGREATAHITSLYLDKDSQVSVTLGGTLALKEVKNGINGAGTISLTGGTFKAMGDYAITENGARFQVTEHSTIDTNGYYMEINQYLTGWDDITVTGGGKILLIKDLSSYTNHATVTGNGTTVTLDANKTLNGTWTIKDGGTLQTKTNVSIRGTVNIEAGGKTDFGLGTKLDLAQINLRNGATYSGFLNGDGGTITFENGSHFQVKTEDLRSLVDNKAEAMLIASTINIENGDGLFRFTGGDSIINDTLLDATQTKTLIYGKDAITVGGLGNTTATAAHNLTDQQLAAMIGDNTYRWLTFQLTADKTGDTGSKLNLTVTRHVNFGELAQTANQAAIAPTLSHIGMQGGKADSTLIGEQLNQLGLALTKATDNAGQMLSNISLSTSSVLNGYTVQRENLRRHTYDLRDRAVQERPCALRHQYETLENTLWANGIGATYTVDGDNNAVGHTTSQWGGQLGMSRCINDNLVMGIAFTYTDSELTLDQGMGKATSSAYYIDLYAKYHKDNWNLTGVLTGGITDLDTTRHMNIPGYSSTTTGSSTGNQIMGLVELGYEIDLYGDRSNILEPFATLNAGYSTIDSFREKGAGTAGLDIASQNMASAAIGAGLRYVKEYSAGNDNLQKGRFEIRAMILQDLTDTATDIEARFIGAPGQNFTQKSVEPGKTGLLLGTGIVIPATINLSLFADLDGEFRDSETGCRANIGLKYAF